MNWYRIFYWFSVVDNLSDFALAFAIVFTIIGFIAFLVRTFNGPWEEDSKYDLNKKFIDKRSKYIFRWCIPFVVIFWLSFLFIPTKKQMLMIVAGGSVGTFIQGDSSIKALPADVTKYLHLSMKKEIEGLSLETKEELGLATPKDKLLNKVKDMTKEELVDYLKQDTTILK